MEQWSFPIYSFSEALQYLKCGKKVSRIGWNGKDMWIALQVPTEESKMTSPYIYMKCANGKFCPWLGSQTDLLAEDWMVLNIA